MSKKYTFDELYAVIEKRVTHETYVSEYFFDTFSNSIRKGEAKAFEADMFGRYKEITLSRYNELTYALGGWNFDSIRHLLFQDDYIFPHELLISTAEKDSAPKNCDAIQTSGTYDCSKVDEAWETAIRNSENLKEKKILYALYHRAKGKTHGEIGAHFGKTARTAERWIEKGRGEALRVQKGLPLP